MTIFSDDGYQIVDRNDVAIGDIAIYKEQGDFSHSGIIVRVDRIGITPVIWVLSKWGHAHEVVHKLYECPYASQPDSEISFWRMIQ